MSPDAFQPLTASAYARLLGAARGGQGNPFARLMTLLSSLAFLLTGIFGALSYLEVRPLLVHDGGLRADALVIAMETVTFATGLWIYFGPYRGGTRLPTGLVGAVGVLLVAGATAASAPVGSFYALLFVQVLIFGFYGGLRGTLLYLAALAAAALPLLLRPDRWYAGFYLVLVPVFTLASLYGRVLAEEFQRQRAERRLLAVLMEAGTLSTSAGLSETLAVIARGLARIMRARYVATFVAEDGAMRPFAVETADGAPPPPAAGDRKDPVQALAEPVGAGGEPLVFDPKDGRPALVGVPIEGQDVVLGAFVIGHDRPAAGHVHPDALRLLSNHAAIVLRNRRLYEATRTLALTDPLTGLYPRAPAGGGACPGAAPRCASRHAGRRPRRLQGRQRPLRPLPRGRGAGRCGAHPARGAARQ